MNKEFKFAIEDEDDHDHDQDDDEKENDEEKKEVSICDDFAEVLLSMITTNNDEL